MLFAATTPTNNTFGFLLETIDTYLTTFMAVGVSGVQGPILTTSFAVGGMYLALQGWMIVYGHSDGSITTVFKSLFKFMLIYGVATSSLYYGQWIVDFFWKLPEAIGSIVISTAAGASSVVLDTAPNQIDGSVTDLMKTYQDSVTKVTDKVAQSGKYVPKVIAAILNMLMQLPMIAALFIVLIAKVGLAIMIVLGPLAILCLLFGWSKSMFEGWLRQSMTFVLTAILAYTVIALLVSILNTYSTALLADNLGAIKWALAVPLALVAVICAIVFKQVPSFSAGLVGGIALSTGGVGAAAAGAAAKGGAAAAVLTGKGSRAAGGRMGRAIGRNAKVGASRAMAKMPPRVQQQIKRGQQQIKRGTVKGIRTAQKADYYTGGKNAVKPKAKPKPKA